MGPWGPKAGPKGGSQDGRGADPGPMGPRLFYNVMLMYIYIYAYASVILQSYKKSYLKLIQDSYKTHTNNIKII